MSTSTDLVEAAEGFFADDGFEGASLRAVMRAAGSDPGAVHYHFGGREALAAAVLDRVLGPLNKRRLELLAAAEAAANQADSDARGIGVETLVEAIVRPDLEATARLDAKSSGRGRLIGAIYVNPAAFVTAEVESHFRPVAQRFMPHFASAVPHVRPETMSWRVRWCLFGALGALLLDREEPFTVGLDNLVHRLAVTGAAAISAEDTN